MTIYQIHRYGGEYEDFYDLIEESYISKDRAYKRKRELEDELKRNKVQSELCYNCDAFNFNLKEKPSGNPNCKRHDVYYDKEYNEYDCYNRVPYTDVDGFTIEEIEVIE